MATVPFLRHMLPMQKKDRWLNNPTDKTTVKANDDLRAYGMVEVWTTYLFPCQLPTYFPANIRDLELQSFSNSRFHETTT